MRTRIVTIILALVALLAISISVQAQSSEQQPTEIRIGYQRNGVWPLIKAKGVIEQLYPNITVTWAAFTAGQPLLEALNAGAIDIGSTGDTPPIFAQAAGAPLVYVSVIS